MTDTTPVEPADEAEKEGEKLELIPVQVLDSEPRKKPKFYVLDDVFVAQTDEGEMRISLKIKTKTVRLMEDLPSREQLDVLLTSRGEEAMIEQLDELDIVDSREIVRKFFQAFGEKQQARLGESFRSSHS